MDIDVKVIGDAAKMVYESGKNVLVWLNLYHPLTQKEVDALKRWATNEAQVIKVGNVVDRRIDRTIEGPEELGDYAVPVQLAVALPGMAQARTGVALAAEYAASAGRWAIGAAKVGVAFMVAQVAMNVTDSETGTTATLGLIFPLLLIALIVYLITRRS
jgi:hypothetical protein